MTATVHAKRSSACVLSDDGRSESGAANSISVATFGTCEPYSRDVDGAMLGYGEVIPHLLPDRAFYEPRSVAPTPQDVVQHVGPGRPEFSHVLDRYAVFAYAVRAEL